MKCCNEMTYHSSSGDETKCVLYSDEKPYAMSVEISNMYDFDISIENLGEKEVKFNVDCQMDISINKNDNPKVYEVFEDLFFDLKDMYIKLGNKIDNHVNVISHRALYGRCANEIDFYLDEENNCIKIVFSKKKPEENKFGRESMDEIGSSVYIPITLQRTGFITNIFEAMFKKLKVAIDEETKDVPPMTKSLRPEQKKTIE